MKVLASVLIVIVTGSVVNIAAPLEMGIGAGPSFTSLDSLNHSIGVLNSLIDHLNQVVSVHPGISGEVARMPSMGTGWGFFVSEYLRPFDSLAIGVHLEYSGASSETAGTYRGSAVSRVDVAYQAQLLGVVLGGEFTFVDFGIRLGASAGLGYYYAIVDQRTVFEIPEEYPEDIAGVPPEAEGRYRGGSPGLYTSLNLSFPVFDWFAIGAQVRYRSANIGALRTSQGVPLDLLGDGNSDSLSLHGLSVKFYFSFSIDLSLDGGKETVQ